jgi:1-acyl-sn-glycerol-3-phosphate acyltransferase
MKSSSADLQRDHTETQCREQHRDDLLPRRSAWLFELFRKYCRYYAHRHFHAVRVARDGPIPNLHQGPLIIVLNHPSWWDPVIGLILCRLMPDWRIHFAPIDARGLAQYRFLERLGFFGVEVGTTRGGLSFLRKACAILTQPESVLWISAQGEFVDPRQRPVRLKQGVGHLVHRLSNVTIVPLAVEYPYWNDRFPEALTRFGRPIAVKTGWEHTPQSWTESVEHALEETQDRLAEQALRRDPSLFTTVLSGRAGVGGVYDLWRRVKAILKGIPFDSAHQVEVDSHRHSPAIERCETAPRVPLSR